MNQDIKVIWAESKSGINSQNFVQGYLYPNKYYIIYKELFKDKNVLQIYDIETSKLDREFTIHNSSDLFYKKIKFAVEQKDKYLFFVNRGDSVVIVDKLTDEINTNTMKYQGKLFYKDYFLIDVSKMYLEIPKYKKIYYKDVCPNFKEKMVMTDFYPDNILLSNIRYCEEKNKISFIDMKIKSLKFNIIEKNNKLKIDLQSLYGDCNLIWAKDVLEPNSYWITYNTSITSIEKFAKLKILDEENVELDFLDYTEEFNYANYSKFSSNFIGNNIVGANKDSLYKTNLDSKKNVSINKKYLNLLLQKEKRTIVNFYGSIVYKELDRIFHRWKESNIKEYNFEDNIFNKIQILKGEINEQRI